MPVPLQQIQQQQQQMIPCGLSMPTPNAIQLVQNPNNGITSQAGVRVMQVPAPATSKQLVGINGDHQQKKSCPPLMNMMMMVNGTQPLPTLTKSVQHPLRNGRHTNASSSKSCGSSATSSSDEGETCDLDADDSESEDGSCSEDNDDDTDGDAHVDNNGDSRNNNSMFLITFLCYYLGLIAGR